MLMDLETRRLVQAGRVKFNEDNLPDNFKIDHEPL